MQLQRPIPQEILSLATTKNTVGTEAPAATTAATSTTAEAPAAAAAAVERKIDLFNESVFDENKELISLAFHAIKARNITDLDPGAKITLSDGRTIAFTQGLILRQSGYQLYNPDMLEGGFSYVYPGLGVVKFMDGGIVISKKKNRVCKISIEILYEKNSPLSSEKIETKRLLSAFPPEERAMERAREFKSFSEEVKILKAYIGHKKTKDLIILKDGRVAIIMPNFGYSWNIGLPKLLEQKDPLQRVCLILAETALQLSAFHKMGYIHVDIKTANLFLTTDGVARIGDFGFSYKYDPQHPEIKTSFDGILVPENTPRYFPCPKRFPASDIYALALAIISPRSGILPEESYKNITIRKVETSDLKWLAGYFIENKGFKIPEGSKITVQEFENFIATALQNQYSTICPSNLKKMAALITRMLLENPEKRPKLNEIAKQFIEIARAIGTAGKLKFNGTKLCDVDFRELDLRQADFSDCDLTGADFTCANLTEAKFTGANLTGVKFIGANLTGVKFAGANLTGADFTCLNLTGADFTCLNLTRAKFANANLTGVDFTGADLTGADFIGADLAGAKFAGANLTGLNLLAPI